MKLKINKYNTSQLEDVNLTNTTGGCFSYDAGFFIGTLWKAATEGAGGAAWAIAGYKPHSEH